MDGETRSNFKEGLPTGWTTRVVPRLDQSKKTKADTYWYSPIQSYSFPSMEKVNRFLEILEETDGDEVKAYNLCKRKKKRKNMDVPNIAVKQSAKVRKSKDKIEKLLLVVQKSDDDDKDSSESEEDGGNSEREEEEIPDSWNCGSEEDEMPDSWNCGMRCPPTS